MNRERIRFPLFFAAVLLCCVVLWSAYVPLISSVRFQLSDVSLSLETSTGRERKQQFEYDNVVRDLPAAKQELEEVQPLTDEALRIVRELKEERKRLREELKALKEAEPGASQQEAAHDHEK